MTSDLTCPLLSLLLASIVESCFCLAEAPGVTVEPGKSETSETLETQNVFRPVSSERDSVPESEESVAKPVSAQVYPQYDQLERGGKMLIAVELKMEDHWHVNANPARPDFLVPTEVRVVSPQRIKVRQIIYPKPKSLKIRGTSEPYEVYRNGALIFVQIEAAQDEKSPAANLEVHLSLQACKENECMTPEEIVLNGRIPMAEPGTRLRKLHTEKFSVLQKESQKAKPEAKRKI